MSYSSSCRSDKIHDFEDMLYGVPANLNLSDFSGDQLEQVCLRQYQIQFLFASGAGISVEGRWELTDSAGAVVDGADRDSLPYSQPRPLKVHLLLGKTVTECAVNAPTFFRCDSTLVTLCRSSMIPSSTKAFPFNRAPSTCD